MLIKNRKRPVHSGFYLVAEISLIWETGDLSNIEKGREINHPARTIVRSAGCEKRGSIDPSLLNAAGRSAFFSSSFPERSTRDKFSVWYFSMVVVWGKACAINSVTRRT